MFRILLLMVPLGLAFSAGAASTVQNDPVYMVQRVPFGSGMQNGPGVDAAEQVPGLNVLHVPQYMPGYPTAATIWPRVVTVKCRATKCEGYTITPDMGRGEYLFILPDPN